MKIVRYSKSGSKANPVFGLLNGEIVNEILGNPLAPSFEVDDKFFYLSDVKLYAPCTPTKIVAVALNYPGISGFSSSMSEPVVLVKPPSTLCGQDDLVENPFPGQRWWGEAELGVVIKNRIKNISEADVASNILGFTIANDTSVENVEGRDHHLARSKCPDNFCSVGPWVDTEFDPSDCIVEAYQNDELIRRGNSKDQFWNWKKIISEISKWMTLEPWDLILTGNPPDTVGMRYLGSDDLYAARISGLGELRNHFICKSGIKN